MTWCVMCFLFLLITNGKSVKCSIKQFTSRLKIFVQDSLNQNLIKCIYTAVSYHLICTRRWRYENDSIETQTVRVRHRRVVIITCWYLCYPFMNIFESLYTTSLRFVNNSLSSKTSLYMLTSSLPVRWKTSTRFQDFGPRVTCQGNTHMHQSPTYNIIHT